MAKAHPNSFLNHIRQLLGSVSAAALTDAQLLEQLLVKRDETAVEVLVRRYGPLVFGVCRRVLRNDHAAEDAFQATFLVLMRKAASLDRGQPLGSWLYTVAYRLALSARANQQRRQRCETQAARRRLPIVEAVANQCDRIVALEEELQRLSPRHRAPLVLCYLEGKTNDQAAEILGCPRGSMAARLAQARERLRAGLTRRGFVVPTAGIATLLAATIAEAAVPLPLVCHTVRAALWFASEEVETAGFVSTQALALAQGAFRSMVLNKFKIVAAMLLAAATLGAGATMLLRAAPQADSTASAKERPSPEARPGGADAPGKQLPRGVLARMGTTRLRHGDAISSAAYSPDGKTLLTAGGDKTVRLWDLATGQELHRFNWGDTHSLDAGRGSAEDEPAQRREQQFWDDTARSCQAALSPDGRTIAASLGGVVRLWEAASGKQLLQLQTEQSRLIQLTFSGDGKSLLTLGPGQASALWEIATGKCIRRSQGTSEPMYFAPPSLIALQNAVVSPGLKYLAYWRQNDTGSGGWIQIRDLRSGQELSRIHATTGTMAMAFSANDKILAWAAFPEVAIVLSDVSTGKDMRRLKSAGFNGSENSMDAALAIALSADGKSLAVSWMSHTIEIWDLKSGRQTLPVGKTTNARFEQQSTDWLNILTRPALAFSPDGKKLVCSQGGPTVRQFRTDTGVEIQGPNVGQVGYLSYPQGHRSPISTLALSADGKSLWTFGPDDPAVRSWDWIKGKETGKREAPASATHAVFANDGRFGFAAGYDFTLRGASGDKTWKVAADNAPLMAVALSPDGALLATRNFVRAEVHLWDTKTGKERYVLGQATDANINGGVTTETTGVLSPDLVFSPDGHCLAGAGPGRHLCLWDVNSGALLWELLPQAGQAIERFAFSPCGRNLATLQADGTVVLYEVATHLKRGQLGEADSKPRRLYLTDGSRSVLDSLQMRPDAPVCLAFSADGRYLASAQHTPTIHLWDVLTGREIEKLQGHEGGVVSLLFAPDGKHLFSGGTDTTALTWDLTRLPPPAPADAAKIPRQVLDALWNDLAEKDAPKAFAAIGKLSNATDQAVTLLKKRLRPASAPDDRRLARLMADLQNDRFDIRRQAEGELEALGELAEPALRQALAGDPPLDLRQRVQRLLDVLLEPVSSGGRVRELRAVEVLELIDGAEARQLLQALARGVPTARLTREAKCTLERLSKRAVTP